MTPDAHDHHHRLLKLLSTAESAREYLLRELAEAAEKDQAARNLTRTSLAAAEGMVDRIREVVSESAKRLRKPPEAGMPQMAVPPKGPLPLQGGAEAPLRFDRDEDSG